MALFRAVGLIAVFVSIQAVACIDISGDYSGGYDGIGRELVGTIAQKSCDLIGAGTYRFNWQTGTKEEMTSPIFMYVNEQHPELCPLNSKKCVQFSIAAEKVSFVKSGLIQSGRASCAYNRVEWDLIGDKRDLRQTYIINDLSPFCAQAQKVEKILKRFNGLNP